MPQTGLSAAWRLYCLPGVSFTCQAFQAAALRKKARAAAKALWRSHTSSKMILCEMFEMEG
jgi:hypothetical protein